MGCCRLHEMNLSMKSLILCFSILVGTLSLAIVWSAEFKCLKFECPFFIWSVAIFFKSKNKTPWMCAAPEVTVNELSNQYWIHCYRELTSHLKFRPETVVFNPQFTLPVVNHCLDEGLHTKLEIACSQENISPDVLMNARVLLKKGLNWFSIDPALLLASIVNISDFVITQKCSEVLRVPDVFTFSQYCRL